MFSPLLFIHAPAVGLPEHSTVTATEWGDNNIDFLTATPANFIDASSEMMVRAPVDPA